MKKTFYVVYPNVANEIDILTPTSFFSAHPADFSNSHIVRMDFPNLAVADKWFRIERKLLALKNQSNLSIEEREKLLDKRESLLNEQQNL